MKIRAFFSPSWAGKGNPEPSQNLLISLHHPLESPSIIIIGIEQTKKAAPSGAALKEF
ncbi:MAG: hypothetical protein ACSHYF_16520 [Verrucomicrobiaceae bacterium]